MPDDAGAPQAARSYTVMLLPGDGVGPEIVAAARRVLAAAGARFGLSFAYEEGVMGGCAIDAFGTPMEDGLIERCRACDAVLLGAVGGPRWDTTDPHKPRPEQGLLDMRKGLGLFANLRPVKSFRALAHNSTLKPEVIDGVDMLVVRELTGGVYFGKRERTADTAYDTMIYSEAEVERLVEYAFTLAEGRRGLLHSVDKANVLESSRLWRAVAIRVAAAPPRRRAAPHARGQLRHAVHPRPQAVRRDRHREPLRRRAQRRGGDAHGEHRHAAVGERGGRRRQPLRADPRLGARHRRPGARQPVCHDPQRRHDARPELRRASRRRAPSRGPSRRPSSRARARPTSPLPARTRSVPSR